MKNIFSIILTLTIIAIVFACSKEENLLADQEVVDQVQAPSESSSSNNSNSNSCVAETLLCSPPIAVDTSCVRMQMLIDGIPYQPIANFTCILTNPITGMEQLWINGSIILANKVVTLRMPLDIEPGNYPIVFNTMYDALYVPTINADNFLGTSGNLFIEKHDTICNYIVGGFDFNAENLQSPVQPDKLFEEGLFWANY